MPVPKHLSQLAEIQATITRRNKRLPSGVYWAFVTYAWAAFHVGNFVLAHVYMGTSKSASAFNAVMVSDEKRFEVAFNSVEDAMSYVETLYLLGELT